MNKYYTFFILSKKILQKFAIEYMELGGKLHPFFGVSF